MSKQSVRVEKHLSRWGYLRNYTLALPRLTEHMKRTAKKWLRRAMRRQGRAVVRENEAET